MTSGADHRTVPPETAAALFGDRIDTAARYAELLAGAGVERGLIGPREVPRLWDRHILNCAVVEELVPHGADLVDVGSGAGLPGVVLGILRPDVSVVLLEPLLRRTVFLREVVASLELENVRVERGRAEEQKGLAADIVTARAVAPLTRLAGWALPLLRKDGSLLALKGEQAESELESARKELSALRPCAADVIRVGSGKVDPATTVVRITVTSESERPHPSRRAAAGRKKRGRKR
ncbi:16S rRNA (guanine(527)-N(7))-methyltransferase RsmG [Nocardiopsis suaedae]|uniref:Ribosomal RNA small subunit methyltransferase G n=1 Tax=Nocardiopsis suaedae TaxID=3018444 RepID=A0ABT4TTK8_9ACTN|nr:16S rRNA (guanine(527)-N(7))-methyltransferase RsmG [Nocardiopsis suaedae]MDA2808030.1 16S rRNA (guanine(527)-N(7))-methyltransferase RsmG [Nocardiopsis suaedae]